MTHAVYNATCMAVNVSHGAIVSLHDLAHCTLGILATCIASGCGDTSNSSVLAAKGAPAPSPSETATSPSEFASEPPTVALQTDLRTEIRSVAHRFKSCARMVADSYRSRSKANHKVTLRATLDIIGDGISARVMHTSFEAPEDVPPGALSCYESLFPRAFASTAIYEGKIAYPICISVLPRAVEES